MQFELLLGSSRVVDKPVPRAKIPIWMLVYMVIHRKGELTLVLACLRV